MAGIRDLKDDEITRFLRFSVAESAAATYTEQSFDTQLSIDRGLIWIIHSIEMQMAPTYLIEVAAGASENLYAQVTRESQSAIVNLDDPDCIAFMQKSVARSAAIGTDAGPLWIFDPMIPYKLNFHPGLPYAAQNIHVGVLSSAASANTVIGRVSYTLRKVSDKFFYRVAQALIS